MDFPLLNRFDPPTRVNREALTRASTSQSWTGSATMVSADVAPSTITTGTRRKSRTRA